MYEKESRSNRAPLKMQANPRQEGLHFQRANTQLNHSDNHPLQTQQHVKQFNGPIRPNSGTIYDPQGNMFIEPLKQDDSPEDKAG